MANLVSYTLILIGLIAGIAGANSSQAEPRFPRLLDAADFNRSRIHIVSERYDLSGAFVAAEEFIDLKLGKAVYIETSNNVRTTWLVDLKQNSVYKYWPFQCDKYDHSDVSSGLRVHYPYINTVGAPQVDVSGGGKMFVFGITALLETFGHGSVIKQYNRIDTMSPASGDLGGSRIGHKWTESSTKRTQMSFIERPDQGANELQLNSIQIQQDSRTININILSVERDFAPEVYHNEFQLPLIYGCRREEGKLDAEMRKKLDMIAADSNEWYLLRTQARAIDFSGQSPVSTDQSTVELVLSQPAAAVNDIPQAHMTHVQNTGADIKTVVDHFLNVKYEANIADGTCNISNVGTMKLHYEISPVVIEFSKDLKLSLSSKNLNMMICGVSAATFMKLEKKGNVEYAYFSDSFSEVFGSRKLARVVRRYRFTENSPVKLDSIAIWVLDGYGISKISEVYDFKVIESKSFSSDTNCARAFDVSEQCYLDNDEMRRGRDYAWIELDYPVSADLAAVLRDKAEEVKDAFYRSIRTNLNINYQRIPKMELLFTESGLTLKMLLLDSVPLYLIYDEYKGRALDSASIQKSLQVANLHECSEFCHKESCAAFSFSRENLGCSISMAGVDERSLSDIKLMDTYKISPSKKEFLPKNAQRLEHQLKSLQADAQDVSGILGFHELNHLDATKSLKGLGNLRVVFKLNGQSVDLVPSDSRVLNEPKEHNAGSIVAELSRNS